MTGEWMASFLAMTGEWMASFLAMTGEWMASFLAMTVFCHCEERSDASIHARGAAIHPVIASVAWQSMDRFLPRHDGFLLVRADGINLQAGDPLGHCE